MIFLENLALYNTKGEVPQDDDYTLPIGTAEVKHEGTDITVVAYSRMTVVAMEVAQNLEKEGISVEVIDLRSLRPLDRPTIIESVKKTSRAWWSRRTGTRTGSAPRSRRRFRRRRSTTSMRRFNAWRRPRCRCRMPPNYRKHPSLARRI